MYGKQIHHCSVVNISPSLTDLSVVSGQLHRLCWALRNSTEERIDLDAGEKRYEESDDGDDEGTIWSTFGFHAETLYLHWFRVCLFVF